jgi:hypothetical protein
MPWAKASYYANGNLLIMKFKVYTKIKRKYKILVPKWYSVEKHAGKRKNEERVKLVGVQCAHAKNETKFVSMNRLSILEQVQGGFEGENKRKVIKFASIFMFLAQGKPMADYKYLRPLYEFLKLKNTPKKHWSNSSSWEIAKHLHNQVLAATKVIIWGGGASLWP